MALLSLPYALALSKCEIIVKLYLRSNGNRWKKVWSSNRQRSLLMTDWLINFRYSIVMVSLVLIRNSTTGRDWRAYIFPTTGCRDMCTSHSGPFHISLKWTYRAIPSRALALMDLVKTIPPPQSRILCSVRTGWPTCWSSPLLPVCWGNSISVPTPLRVNSLMNWAISVISMSYTSHTIQESLDLPPITLETCPTYKILNFTTPPLRVSCHCKLATSVCSNI